MIKLNRRSRFDDVLFAIAVSVPVTCAAARFLDAEQQAAIVARAQERANAGAIAARTPSQVLAVADATDRVSKR